MVSQSNVATAGLRCVGRLTSLHCELTAESADEEFWNSVNVWRNYGQV